MDIVERLLNYELPMLHEYRIEAADEIERLREKVKLLEQARAASNLAGLGLDVVSGFNAAKEALLKICKKRSAEIEELRKERNELREALKKYKNAYDIIMVLANTDSNDWLSKNHIYAELKSFRKPVSKDK